jgi:hypothetical protein
MNDDRDIDIEPSAAFDPASDRPTPTPVRRLARAEEEERRIEAVRAMLAADAERNAEFLATERKRFGPRHVRVQAEAAGSPPLHAADP